MENAVLILIAEDEQAVRELLGETLEEDGYGVVLAESGEQAVDLLENGADAKGLVTDIRLGGKHALTGWDVARRARELDPDIAVVYLSGDSSADWAVQGVPKSVMVAKPFAMSQISMALASLLNQSG